MSDASGASSGSRIVLTSTPCHKVWQIRTVGRDCSYSNFVDGLRERLEHSLLLQP